MNSVAMGLFVQLVIGMFVLLVNRAEAPKSYWKMGQKNPHGDLLGYERDILRGVSEETPKGVSDGAVYQRIFRLRRTSLGVGFGLGLVMTAIFWLAVIYSSSDLFAY
jgi:hypothetical protein